MTNTPMSIEQLRRELELDEGVRYEIYNDHLGYATFGIGHLVLDHEPEVTQEVGTTVSEDRVAEAFDNDVQTVLADCEILYPEFYDFPAEVQLIVANMMFNMGRPRLSKFKGMKAGVDARDWNIAADEMIDSSWYTQVPQRAGRLVKRMRAVSND